MRISKPMSGIAFSCGRVPILAGLLLTFCLPTLIVAAELSNVEQLRAARGKMAQEQQRRVIFDNDGNEVVYMCEEATREEVLSHRTVGIEETQVDTVVYCTWSSGFSYFTHDTKVGTPFTTKGNPPGARGGYGFAKNITAELIEQGTDPLHIMVDYCKPRDLEIFWSMRMNDTHDVSTSWYGPYLFPPLKKEHPEWLLGSRQDPPKHGRWTAVDYSQPEIRELAFKFFEEVCTNYDVDGVTIDFFRHLNYFPRPAAGLEASQEELDMMTELIRRIREMTERVGLERGRPILMLVRVPDSVGYCKAHGLDLERWLKEGYVDLLATTGYFRLNPWRYSVELGHKYDVPVYACLSESRIRLPESKKIRQTDAAYRGRARNVWYSGADGMYLFNMFKPDRDFCSQIGELETLKGTDKVFTTGARGLRAANYWQENGLRFLNREPISPERPRDLEPGKSVTVDLLVGEDLAGAIKDGLNPSVQLQVRAEALKDTSELAIRLNDKTLPSGQKADAWVNIPVEPKLVVQGDNHFELQLDADASGKLRVDDLVLWVRYK